MNTRRKAIKYLKESGYELFRNGSKHDVYYNAKSKTMITLKRHDFDESDLRYIKKEVNQYKREGK